MRTILGIVVLLAIAWSAVPARAQAGDFPPFIPPGGLSVYVFPPGTFVSQQLLGLIAAEDPSLNPRLLDLADPPVERSVIVIRALVRDLDFDDTAEGNDDLFYRKFSTWLPEPRFPSPTGVPFSGDSSRFRRPQVVAIPAPTDRVIVIVDTIPDINGPNQGRLRGILNYDVFWLVELDLSNNEQPSTGQDGRLQFSTFPFLISALDNPEFDSPNPPPFADAGVDQTVLVNSTVRLDGSASFDSSNFGFDPNDPEVLLKDRLIYQWEWLSGPERRDPVSTSSESPFADVLLSTVGTYVFRLTVSDQVNPLPSTDTTSVTVLSALPANRPPTAVASVRLSTGAALGTAATVQQGSVVQLDGTSSTDPDGDRLSFRWLQVNELGGALTTEEFSSAFQPLSGVTLPVAQWQAATLGTFYFRLLVSDGLASHEQRVSVTVVRSVAAGVSFVAEAEAQSADAVLTEDDAAKAVDFLSSPGACGGGLLLSGLVPFLLLPMRRARRNRRHVRR